MKYKSDCEAHKEKEKKLRNSNEFEMFEFSKEREKMIKAFGYFQYRLAYLCPSP